MLDKDWIAQFLNVDFILFGGKKGIQSNLAPWKKYNPPCNEKITIIKKCFWENILWSSEIEHHTESQSEGLGLPQDLDDFS